MELNKKNNETFIPEEWLDGSFSPDDIEVGSKYDQLKLPKTRKSGQENQFLAVESNEPSQGIDPNLMPFASRLDPHSRRAKRAYYDNRRKAQLTQLDTRPLSMQHHKEFRALTAKELDSLMPFDPIEKLGQNYLINNSIAKKFVNYTIPDASVVEVGVGTGNMTWGISQLASEVTGLEVYPGYAPCYDVTLSDSKNVKVIFADALSFDYKQWANRHRGQTLQVMGNIPFHISEGLITKLASLGDSISAITLLVGGNLRDIIEASDNPYSNEYSKLAFYLSIYDKSPTIFVNKNDFWPTARVTGGLVNLTPRDFDPNGKDLALKVKKQLILNPDLSVAKILNGLSNVDNKGRDKRASHRYERRQVKTDLRQMLSGSYLSQRNLVVEKVNLSPDILNTPFNRLNNQQIQSLAIALDDL